VIPPHGRAWWRPWGPTSTPSRRVHRSKKAPTTREQRLSVMPLASIPPGFPRYTSMNGLVGVPQMEYSAQGDGRREEAAQDPGE
jgi:hypothetical protein